MYDPDTIDFLSDGLDEEAEEQDLLDDDEAAEVEYVDPGYQEAPGFIPDVTVAPVEDVADVGAFDEPGKRSTHGRRNVRVRPMPAVFMRKWPDIQTLLITNRDGRQKLLVRPSGRDAGRVRRHRPMGG